MGKCSTEVWSRVCGFFRPINNWNPGKTEEHGDKKEYNLKEAYEKVQAKKRKRSGNR